MKGVNKAILLGNTGKDPEIRTTAGGMIVASFSLAVANGNPMWHVIDTQCEDYRGFKKVTIDPELPQAEMWARLIADQLNRGGR